MIIGVQDGTVSIQHRHTYPVCDAPNSDHGSDHGSTLASANGAAQDMCAAALGAAERGHVLLTASTARFSR
jgi:hypothetical protein